MPNKNASLRVLQRWMAMDFALSQRRLYVKVIARQWGVSTRTVHRDLAAFKKLGQRTDLHRDHELLDYFFTYQKGVQPLFVSNLRR
jgi:hypothetical protein